MSKLLINEPPLQVLPTLATKIGLNEAIFLQQLHYWITSPIAKNIDGHYWIYNKVDKWVENFPFWSKRTIERIIAKLETKNLIVSGNYNQNRYDQTKWYRINFDALNELEKEPVEEPKEAPVEEPKEPKNPSDTPSRQDGGVDENSSRQDGGMEPDKMADSSSRQSGGLEPDKVAGPIPETTSETTTEITKENTLTSEFEEFWCVYPKKEDKKKAFERFKAALKNYSAETIIIGAANYAAHIKVKKTERRYIKLPTTFLNAESFLNEFDLEPDGITKGTTQLPRAYQSLQDWAAEEE